ncbi:Uncharacterised protein [Acinetobacter baumannii]|nr:Uncharacterised protein [Acinetobacter baumannii]
MDKLILNLVKDGKNINEVLNMPYHFLIEILNEQNKPNKKEKSLIAAFGG